MVPVPETTAVPAHRALRSLRAALVPLQLGAVLIPIAGSGVVTLIPRLSEVHQRSVSSVGLTITIYMIPFAAAQLFAGGLAQRFTARRTVSAGFAAFIGGSLGCALAPSFPGFLVFRLVQGMGAAFLFPVFMALVGELAPREQLGRVFGAYQSALVGGMAVGPLLAGILEVWFGWRAFFVYLALHAGVAAVIFFAVFGREPGSSRPVGALAVTFRALREPAVVVVSLAAGGLFFAVVGTNTYLAAFLKAARGLSEDTIGLVLALHGAIGIPVCPLAGRWGDQIGRRRLGAIGLVAYGAAVATLGVLPYSFPAVVGLATLLGAAAAVGWTSLGALMVDLLPDLRQPVSSVYNAFRFLGYALAPPVLGLLYVDGHVLPVFLATALVVFGSAASLAALRPPRRGDS